MDATMQAVEEEIMQSRFPITYQLIKAGLVGKASDEEDHTLQWMKWYTEWGIGDTLGTTEMHIIAQVGWEPDKGRDQIIGTFVSEKLAKSAVTAHNVALENVQRPDFGKAKP